MKNAFIGFPEKPKHTSDTISNAIGLYRDSGGETQLIPWTELDGPSNHAITPDILKSIRDCEGSYFDITNPNENVFYEIGYAIGIGKPVYLLINSGYKDVFERQMDLGIFDTSRLRQYTNSHDIHEIIKDTQKPYIQSTMGIPINIKEPLFFQKPYIKDEFAIKYFSKAKSQGYRLREHNASEEPRLPLERAYKEVVSSSGVFLSIIPSNIKDSDEHNLRTFLLAGIADASNVPKLVLKQQDTKVSFDLRDEVENIADLEDIEEKVKDFIPDTVKRYQQTQLPQRRIAKSHLINLSLGSSVAENELVSLNSYFLETREFKRTLRGDANIVAGKKGTGKTAIFWQVRNRIRANKSQLVIDLRPEGFQLKKLNELVAKSFSEATHSHTMVAFWEYVLYLEIAHKIIADDERTAFNDPSLTDSYIELRDTYENTEELRAGDFPERLLRLINRLKTELLAKEHSQEILTTPQITNIIQSEDIPLLRTAIFKYLRHKKKILILIDNLDSGWSASGVSPDDIKIIQCLMNAGRKIQRKASHESIDLSTVIFIRDDVYEWLVKESNDRGKDQVIKIDWSDHDQLRELVQQRLTSSCENLNIDPPLLWNDIAEGRVENNDILDYLISRCLNRPRVLIDLIELSLSYAALAGSSKIKPTHAKKAVKSYSTEMLRNLNYEIGDIFPVADKVIYDFAHENERFDLKKLEKILHKRLSDKNDKERFINLLIWFAFIGYIDKVNSEVYIYDVGDDMDLLRARAGKSGNPILCIHPVFREALLSNTGILF